MSLSSPVLTWGEFLARLVAEHGSLAAVALKVSMAVGGDVGAASVERGLRRLRSKRHGDGGRHGQWLLRTFGMPKDVEQRARWMGVYHSRFTDLPVSLCFDQLQLWNRPPLADSRAGAWLQLGLATVALRRGDLDGAAKRLGAVRGGHGHIAARIEARLLEAYLASRRGARAEANAILEDLADPVRDPHLEPTERACLVARWLNQRAYQLLHPPEGSAADVPLAKRLYERIPERDAPAFAACKRDMGLAYVALRCGQRRRAVAHAELACRHSGDGGFVRMRIAALGLLAHVLGEKGRQARARAVAAARQLEDEDLVARVERVTSP